MSVQDDVREFIVTRFGWDTQRLPLTNELPLVDAGVIDSLGILDLIAFVEARFAITVADEDLLPANFETIDAIAAFVAAKESSRR